MAGESHKRDLVVTPQELEARVEALMSCVREAQAATAAGLPFAEQERRVRELAAAVEGAATATVLACYEPTEPVFEFGGRTYRRLPAPSGKTYCGMASGLRVLRHLYREVGVRNGPTIVPLELRAGIVEGLLTPGAARATAYLVQSLPSREAKGVAQQLGVLPLSRTSMARVGESIGQRWEDRRIDAENHLLDSLEIPDETSSVSVSIDRVSMPMEEPREVPPGPRPKGAAKRPIEVAYRMAYCAVVTLHDSKGRPLSTTRYGRMPGDASSRRLEGSLVGDLHSLMTQRADLKLVALADGAHEMWNMLGRVTRGLEVHAQRVDFWHLVEKLSAAVTSTGRDAKTKLKAWKRKLKQDDSAIDRIEVELKTWALDFTCEPEPLHEALTYIKNHRERLRYASAVASGLPIGSGYVEATCKTIVATRMKRSGARWKTDGGQAIMNLRCLAISARWQAGLDFLLGTYVAGSAAVA